MQRWVDNFAREWVEYPFLAMPANTNAIANVQCERNLKNDVWSDKKRDVVINSSNVTGPPGALSFDAKPEIAQEKSL